MTTDLSQRAEMPRVVERRSMPFRGVELRAKPDGTGGETLLFTGYASVTETPYEMQDWLGPYTEVIRSGAFKKTLNDGADVPFLINHGGMTLARTKSGTLRLSEDDTGLYTEADLDPASPTVQTLRSAMERGDVDEMSFAFWITRRQWSPDFEQLDILEVNLNKGDVSVVNYGANPATAGAQLNARELGARLAQLDERDRREVYERLALEFAPVSAAVEAEPAPAGRGNLGLYLARAKAIGLGA
jgi:HK97 family phage prohead protease